MTSAAATVGAPPAAWLRGPAFDLTFIFGAMLAALVSGGLVLHEPKWFGMVLFVDLWVFGYHHVIATFTRLCFDTDSFRRHRFLVLVLPLLVTAVCISAGLLYGRVVLATAYLYWQWFHYTRQSYGIRRIYNRKNSGGVLTDDRLVRWLMYAVPVWCILQRSYQSPSTFLGTALWVLPVPKWLVVCSGAFAIALLAAHAVREVRAFAGGRAVLSDSLYILSHNAIFLVAYVVIQDLDNGWLVVSVWHNAQYILLVWMFNNNRFKHGVDARHWLLSTLSQSKNAALYFGFCLALSTALYFAINTAIVAFAPHMGVDIRAMVMTIYSAINFHHYLVDGLIWKVREPKLQQNLGIAA
jgi:hypothetical protein